MPIHELMGKQQPCFDLMAMKNKHSSGSYQSYEVPKPDLGTSYHGFLKVCHQFWCVFSHEVATFLNIVVFNLQFLVVSTCLNPMLLLLNLQMSVGLLRILLVPKPDKIAGQAGRAQKKTELRIDWVHQLSHLWVVQMLGASLDHFGNTLPSSLKPKTWDGRNWWANFSSG